MSGTFEMDLVKLGEEMVEKISEEIEEIKHHHQEKKEQELKHKHDEEFNHQPQEEAEEDGEAKMKILPNEVSSDGAAQE